MGSPPEKGFGQGSVPLAHWAEKVYQPEDDILAKIRALCASAGLPPIQVGRFDGLHLEVLARMIGARRAVEIGTLGGYSGVCLLRGMTPDGLLDTFELSHTHAEVALESFRLGGFGDRVRIHVGPALETLGSIEQEGPFDLIFIDADKVGYPAYLDWAAEHLRIGGIVIGDNAFGWGGVADPKYAGENADSIKALRTFSENLAGGGRFRATMIPTEEGLALGVKVR